MTRQVRTWLIVRIGVAVVLGVSAGVAWALLADPAQWTVTETGLSMGAEGAAGEFSAVVTFVVIGAVVAGMWGASTGAARRGSRPSTLVLHLGLAVLAGILAWRVGLVVGPSEPSGIAGREVGDLVDDQLRIGGWVPFLAWPFGMALGTFSSNLFLPDSAREGGHGRHEARPAAP